MCDTVTLIREEEGECEGRPGRVCWPCGGQHHWCVTTSELCVCVCVSVCVFVCVKGAECVELDSQGGAWVRRDVWRVRSVRACV